MTRKSKQLPQVSIVIANWNGQKWHSQCLPTLISQTYRNIEIIVADNASTDSSVAWLARYYPNIKVFKAPNNLGYGNANNLGAKRASGIILFFLNNDTILEKNTVESLIKYKLDHNINIVGPIIYDMNKIDIYKGRKISIDPLSVHGWGRNTFYIDGCALMIDKADFQKLRGFDSEYFMYNEDIDLCWRAQLFGMKVEVVDNSGLIHFGGGSSTKTMWSKETRYHAPLARRYEVEKNNLRNILKNYSPSTLLLVVPLFILQLVAEISLYLVTLNFPMIIVIFRAIAWNITHLANTFKERKYIQSYRKVNDMAILKHMTLPFNKVRTFLLIGLPKFQ